MLTVSFRSRRGEANRNNHGVSGVLLFSVQEENLMPCRMAIALFRTLGTAEDALNRLLQRGVPEEDLDLRRLSKDTTLPPNATPRTTISLVLGRDLTGRYDSYVRNGETVLSVQTRTDGELRQRSR